MHPLQTHVQRPRSPLPPRLPVCSAPRLPRRRNAADRDGLHRNAERLPHVRPQQGRESRPLFVQSLGAGGCGAWEGVGGRAGILPDLGELLLAGREHPRLFLFLGGGSKEGEHVGGEGEVGVDGCE